MRTLDRPLPDANAPPRLANEELRDIVAAYVDREKELLHGLEDAQVAVLANKQEFDYKDSKIKGLQRRLDALDAEKIAVLVFSPTGHHNVQLAGPWTMSDYGHLLRPFRQEVHLQTGDSKNPKAVAGMRERLQLERDEELAVGRMSPEERQEHVDRELASEPDLIAKPADIDATTGNAFPKAPVVEAPVAEIPVEDTPDKDPQPDGDIDIEKPVSGMADFSTGELPKVKRIGHFGRKQGDKTCQKKS